MSEILKKIDGVLKGAKTYLNTALGLAVVSYLESKGVDAVGLVDTLIALVNNPTFQTVAGFSFSNLVIRSAMSDKRGGK